MDIDTLGAITKIAQSSLGIYLPAEFRRRISDAYDAHQRAIDREEERDRRRGR